MDVDIRNNILIGWPNHARWRAVSPFGVPSVGISGGNWLAALPLANLLTREPWRVARSVGLVQAATQFDVSLQTWRSLRAVALGNHNLSPGARWRIQLGTMQGGADVYDSAWQAVWSMTWDADGLDWEDASVWEGVVDDPSAYAGYPYPALHVLPDWLQARNVRVLIDDPANTAGYVQIGQIMACGGLQPRYSASYGLKDSWLDPTQVTESESGYAFADPRRRRRRVQFATEHLSITEAAIAHELQRRQGVWGEVLWVPYPWSQAEAQRYGFIGRMTELSAIDYPYVNTRGTGWAITEI